MDTKGNIIRILNVFENDSASPNTDYTSIYLYHDGKNDSLQVTLGRGFTECGGVLWMVFSKYKELVENDAVADKLIEYKGDSCKGKLANDDDFLKLIHKACEDQEFKDAQDAIYDKVYWRRGEGWFNENGFKLPLSMAVIQDSYLQSGQILDFLRKRFDAKTPANGGDEKEWITQYVDARNSWLENHSRKVLRNTTYRTHFFQKQIKDKNWNLDKFPIFPNGVKLSS